MHISPPTMIANRMKECLPSLLEHRYGPKNVLHYNKVVSFLRSGHIIIIIHVCEKKGSFRAKIEFLISSTHGNVKRAL